MIAVSAFDLLTTAQVNAQRGTKKGRLDIMCDDRVAPEDYLHVTTPYQVCDVTARPCMDDSRAKHEQYLAVLGTGFFHPASDFMDGEYFGLFGRNCTLHESK